jgi:hypothetical protein
MADIIASRAADQGLLAREFKEIVAETNKEHRASILSPLTITLGDEFQAVFGQLDHALDIVIQLEEKIILKGFEFQMRYVVVEGPIETPINRKIAYGMMGEGLTRARETLNNLKKDSDHFRIDISDKGLEKAISDALFIFNGIKSEWDLARDGDIIREFFTDSDYKTVADRLKKDRSQMWRKEKSLRFSQYRASKDLIRYLADQK